MSHVKLKHKDKVLKVQFSDLNVGNICRIFKLNQSAGVYLIDEKEGEVILPLPNEDFDVLLINDTSVYVVEGEDLQVQNISPSSGESSQTSSSSSIVGKVYSRAVKNPPPAASFVRPSFTTSSTGLKRVGKDQWKKTILVSEVNSNGEVQHLFQTVLILQEETSSVPKESALLKAQLNYEVTLVDSKLLRIVDNDGTKGSQFWKSNRKVIAIKASEMKYLQNASGGMKGKKRKTDDILCHLESLVKSQKDTANPEVQASAVFKNIFRCSICLSTCELPAASCPACHNIIGCIPCLDQWMQFQIQPMCPLCRASQVYQEVPHITAIAKLPGNDRGNQVQSVGASSTGVNPQLGTSTSSLVSSQGTNIIAGVSSQGTSTSLLVSSQGTSIIEGVSSQDMSTIAGVSSKGTSTSSQVSSQDTSTSAVVSSSNSSNQNFLPLTTFQYDDDDDDDDDLPPAFQ